MKTLEGIWRGGIPEGSPRRKRMEKMIYILTCGVVKLMKMITIGKIIIMTICLGLSVFMGAQAYE